MGRSPRIIGVLLLIGAAGGCLSRDKPYLRHPLVREMNVMVGPAPAPERATQVEPYPPPRPYLPDEPSRVATASLIVAQQRSASKFE